MAENNSNIGSAPLTFGQTVNPIDQTKILDTLNRGSHNESLPDNRGGPSRNDLTRNRSIRPGKLNNFVLWQAAHYLSNPSVDHWIVNTGVLVGFPPGEGVVATTFKTPFLVGNEEILGDKTKGKDSVSDSDRKFSAKWGGNLGQENGAEFKPRGGATLGQAVSNAIAGALRIKDTGGNFSPKDTKFETRLAMQNIIDQSQIKRESDVYEETYGPYSFSQDRVSGVKKTTLGEAFLPIWETSDEPQSKNGLYDDKKSVNSVNRAYDSNAPKDYRFKVWEKDGLYLYTDKTPDSTSLDKPTTRLDGMSFPFYFESLVCPIDDSKNERFITFQATFKGIKETYKPNWVPKSYFGRSTKVYTYDSTERTIGFSFTIFAPNRVALGLVKQRINWLARNTYPTYQNLSSQSSQQIIKNGPVIKFTIGDLWRDTPAIITNLDFDWDMENNNRWELTKDMIIPMAVNVTLTMNILDNKLMQNAPYSDGTTLPGSDFYEYIKPDKRGIEVGKREKIESPLTKEETEKVAEKDYGMTQETTRT